MNELLPLQINYLKNADYQTTHDTMLNRTLERVEQKKHGIVTADELWLVDHNNVFTLGQAGKPEHILGQDGTPIIKTDRGGQVTWHGHGQLVAYFLFDLNTLGWGVRDLVTHAENIIINTVNPYLAPNFFAKARQDAPGVYVFNQDGLNQESLELGKIASLGFKIKHGFSYHGIALNLTNDLTPFSLINPCGYAGMTMLKLDDFANIDFDTVVNEFVEQVNLVRT